MRVILFHFRVGLMNFPAIDSHPVDRGHGASAMTAAGTVDEDRPVLFVVDYLKILATSAAGYFLSLKGRSMY